ncbi:diacylglycerol/lipid kinase family protein [Desemzia sp. FAM 23991]|uniref:diacylglycerol/lipid kinase family protein n=1 Tax=unclassified Desemzia TaxID=2685243 RepID=UPI0038872A70
MGEAVLIVNPSSGNEQAENLAGAVEKKLSGIYDKVTVKFTEKGGDAAYFARTAAEEGIAAVFVMGGDGTVNEGINGLAEQEYRPDFSFIPLGTVNDLARALGIPLDPEEAIARLDTLERKQLDIGKINDHYFANVVAIGSIPKAVQGVDVEQKTKLGPLAYFLEGTKALSTNEAYTFELDLDEEKILQESILVLVALTNSVGGFESLLPNASTDDGYLHLLALKGKTVIDKLKVIPKIFTGKAIEDEKVIYRKFKTGTIQIKETKELVANVDGDEGDSLPLTLQVLPQHLTVLVPKSSNKATEKK